MCCGVAFGGRVNESDGNPGSTPATNNLAVCNKDSATDGNPAAENFIAELKPDPALSIPNIGITYDGKNFKCFDSAVPPKKPVPVWPKYPAIFS